MNAQAATQSALAPQTLPSVTPPPLPKTLGETGLTP
ncbi:MAG: hypothetical protein RLZZ563_1831, partial [Pseudomonadota bacterium]